MKNKFVLCMVLAALVAIVSGCGGGGGGGGGVAGGDGTDPGNLVSNSIIVSTTSLSSATTSTSYVANSSDPIITALTSTTNNKTYINMSSGYNLNTYSWKNLVSLTIDGTSAGTYPIASASDPTKILYTEMPKIYQSTSGSITIASIGSVGQPVTGTFEATLNCVSGCTGTIGMSGSFNVDRSQ